MAATPQLNQMGKEKRNVPRRSGARVPAPTFPAAPIEGDLFWETDADILWVWNGTAWKTVYNNNGTDDDTGWLAPSFQNGWGVYGDGNYGISTVYRRYKGVVYLRGLIAGGTLSTTAFTLPAGFRPSSIRYLFITETAGGFTRMDVFLNGEVQPNPGNASWTSLAGVSFPADQ